jgi:proline utilization trans-activator
VSTCHPTKPSQGYLGRSSTWSFSWQIRRFLKGVLGEDASVDLTPQQEGGSYRMASVDFNSAGPFEDDVPSRDYAEYLMTTTLFHFGSIHHLFDEERFLVRLRKFYEFPNSDLSDLWHVEFLLVMALGKLLLGRETCEWGPPGAVEFLRAMRLLPNVTNMYREQILSTEILCCVGVYLYCCDMRSAAHNFVSPVQPHQLKQINVV